MADQPDQLTESVLALLRAAHAAARTPQVAAQLELARARLEGPLRVAIAGKVKAGKSTLLNAMLGEELAATDAGECTQIVTWYQHADQPSVSLHTTAGAGEQRPFRRDGGLLEIDLGDHSAESIDHLEIAWPNPRLRDITLADTPGIASISVDVSARTHRLLANDDDRPPSVDAVIYLLRHTHASDARFLESFHDDELAHGTPVNVVGILSRADEIGSCRMDSLAVAERVARRYQVDQRIRRLCPIVLPVAGLLGFAAMTLRESEYRALSQLARMPVTERSQLLLTVDRFTQRPTTAVTELERTHLAQRLGLFGVRLSIELIATAAVTDANSSIAAAFSRHVRPWRSCGPCSPLTGAPARPACVRGSKRSRWVPTRSRRSAS